MNSLTGRPSISTIAASSVTSSLMVLCASRRRSISNDCGVWAAHSVSLGGVDATVMLGEAILMVSLTGTAAVAAPDSRAASTALSMIASSTNGRAPSWTITISTSPSASRALATESCRLAPPGTTDATLETPYSNAKSRTRATLPDAVAIEIRSTRGEFWNASRQ